MAERVSLPSVVMSRTIITIGFNETEIGVD